MNGRKRVEGTVLVVDDEPLIRRLLVAVLELAGYRVIEASDGGAALEQARQAQPQLVITDRTMPVMNGTELIKRLRADVEMAGIPIILLTETTGGEPQADAVVMKPFDQDELIELVKTLTGHSVAEDSDVPTRPSRDQAASNRDVTADARDRAAELRDRSAERRDATAWQYELSLSEPAHAVSYRALAAEDRGDSAEDRQDAAEDRQEASHDRQDAAVERIEALHERAQAGAAAQRALETLESMSDAFLTLDSEWRFTYLNPQTEAVLERRREDLLGANMWEEFPEAVGSGFDAAYRRALREQVAVRFEEHYQPLGRILEIRAYPIPDGLAVYLSDVTDARRRDAQQRQTQRLELLGQVTAGVAHDFNNLLTAIGGFAKLGQNKYAEADKAIRYFDEIDAASRKAVALTRKLLMVACEQPRSPALIDLNDAVDGLSGLLRQLVPPSVDFRFALSDQPVVVFADRSQVEQVIVNLVVNSRDAMNGPGTITLITATSDPGGGVHDVRIPSGWLQVTDTGSGIPADVLPRIFDPYFTTKSPEMGTGLGLATIYGIILQSDGLIFVDSTVGIGTTMTVALPRESTGSRTPTNA
jgi:signal transduction histidine kinase